MFALYFVPFSYYNVQKKRVEPPPATARAAPGLHAATFYVDVTLELMSREPFRIRNESYVVVVVKRNINIPVRSARRVTLLQHDMYAHISQRRVRCLYATLEVPGRGLSRCVPSQCHTRVQCARSAGWCRFPGSAQISRRDHNRP